MVWKHTFKYSICGTRRNQRWNIFSPANSFTEKAIEAPQNLLFNKR